MEIPDWRRSLQQPGQNRRIIYPYQGQIESGHAEIVMNRIRSHFIDNHVAYVYEDVCREKMWELNFRQFTFDRYCALNIDTRGVSGG